MKKQKTKTIEELKFWDLETKTEWNEEETILLTQDNITKIVKKLNEVIDKVNKPVIVKQ